MSEISDQVTPEDTSKVYEILTCLNMNPVLYPVPNKKDTWICILFTRRADHYVYIAEDDCEHNAMVSAYNQYKDAVLALEAKNINTATP